MCGEKAVTQVRRKSWVTLTVNSVQEDSLNVADLTCLRAPLDIPIPDPPPKDDEVRHSGFRALSPENDSPLTSVTFLNCFPPFCPRWKQISRKRKKVVEEGMARDGERAH